MSWIGSSDIRLDSFLMSKPISRPMLRIDLRSAMFDLRRSLERSLRQQVSEQVLMEVHEAIYTPVRHALDPIGETIHTTASQFGTQTPGGARAT